MSEELSRDNISTAIKVRVAGEYLSHAEMAPLLDELSEHFFTVEGAKDHWEGPAATGSEIVMYVMLGGGVVATTILQELAKGACRVAREKMVDLYHKAVQRKQDRTGTQRPPMVIEAAGVKFLLEETEGPMTQEGLASALRQAAELLESGTAQPIHGPMETWPVLDIYSDRDRGTKS